MLKHQVSVLLRYEISPKYYEKIASYRVPALEIRAQGYIWYKIESQSV
ncbi:hypothetical protein NSIN_30021 [Nitrosotalea sinensis]|uniref:Uncharacterized protein n=1 Tax=Nitrosotalea sinensis TaxID=1499975 RepID=A0A2H1EHK5_9ARCH|nr:hypothetical protein NSIN_30021 [Candidatus Nitrosotalea sinensis]